ncbi:hypothetical protein LBBP_01864 [Leptospira borgpetersenii serovar Ballum]|uniref:HPt domain-containing protein n=2 Tax=Leptospiraceae TaxID=170 RepID=A0A0S2IR71_LEPBO|nr:hypothetical protein LBBP_01864 [Leptospira borgpetersenii serovar Ballum]
MYFHLNLTLALKYKNRFCFFIQAFKDVLNRRNVYRKVAFLNAKIGNTLGEVVDMLVDWNRLDSLKQSDDDDEIAWLKEMVESLLTNMEIRIKNIVRFAEEKKDVELQAELHQTKGVSANFGLEDLRTLVAEAEQFLKTGDQDRSYTLGLKTTVVWEQTRDELKKKFGIF